MSPKMDILFLKKWIIVSSAFILWIYFYPWIYSRISGHFIVDAKIVRFIYINIYPPSHFIAKTV